MQQCAMNLGNGIVRSPPCFGQTPQSAVSSHRSETETGYHVRPVEGLSGDLLQELHQRASKQNIIQHNLLI